MPLLHAQLLLKIAPLQTKLRLKKLLHAVQLVAVLLKAVRLKAAVQLVAVLLKAAVQLVAALLKAAAALHAALLRKHHANAFFAFQFDRWQHKLLPVVLYLGQTRARPQIHTVTLTKLR